MLNQNGYQSVDSAVRKPLRVPTIFAQSGDVALSSRITSDSPLQTDSVNYWLTMVWAESVGAMKWGLSMNKLMCGLALTTGLALAVPAQAAYQLDITTSYGFGYGGPPGTFLGGGTPSPDTGFLSFTNSGPTTFTGTLGFTALSGCCGDMSDSASVTLAPGTTDYFAIGSESSNVGGFGPNGIGIYATGMFGGTPVNLSVNDADVHSGVPRVNPCGETLDSFVLQGGSASGCDTGDGYEVSQAFGHFTFRGGAVGGVPEPATWAMMLLGFGAVGLAVRRARRRSGIPQLA